MASRSALRREALVRRFRRLFPSLGIEGRALAPALWRSLAGQPFDLVVNATPVGLKPRDPALVPASFFRARKLVVYDFIYRPERTKLLRVAAHAGQRTANGLGMLLYQGAQAFEIWTAGDAA